MYLSSYFFLGFNLISWWSVPSFLLFYFFSLFVYVFIISSDFELSIHFIIIFNIFILFIYHICYYLLIVLFMLFILVNCFCFTLIFCLLFAIFSLPPRPMRNIKLPNRIARKIAGPKVCDFHSSIIILI